MSAAKAPIAWRYKTAFGWKIRDEQPPAEWGAEGIFSAETVMNIEKQRDSLLKALIHIQQVACSGSPELAIASNAIDAMQGGAA